MCEFISWIEYGGEVYFLTKKDLQTKEGRKQLKEISPSDIGGHGAIRAYYPELGDRGTNKECSDFSSPSNFPESIVKAIKNGDFEGMGMCIDILTPSAYAEYDKIRQSALSALADNVWRETRVIYTEYEKIKQSAPADYEKFDHSAFWEIARKKENRKEAWK